MLALVDGEPRMLSLKQALRVFLEHRLEVVRRRSEYDLARAQEREHILAGLKIALENLDEVIQIIRGARDADQAHQRLQKRFKLRARAILDMPLKRLSSLERKKVDQEHREVLKRIKQLESLLRSPKKMRGVITDELAALKERYGDRRRTSSPKLPKASRPGFSLPPTWRQIKMYGSCWGPKDRCRARLRPACRRSPVPARRNL